MNEEPAGVSADAVLAAALFAIDPVGLGGVAVRAGPGAPRDRWLAIVRGMLAPGAPVRRIPLNIEDDRLIGGLDLTASLAAGRPIAQRGVLAESHGGVVILAMAERMEPCAAARITGVMDDGEIAVERDGLALTLTSRIGVIALDEGLEADERPPRALLERLAFHLDLGGLGPRELVEFEYAPADIARARVRLPDLAPAGDALIEALCTVSERLGVSSARAALMTLRAARAHAALQGRGEMTSDDAAAATRLVLGPRALTFPAERAASQGAEESASPPTDVAESGRDARDLGETRAEPKPSSDADMMVAAIQAALPADLLARVDLAVPARGAAKGRGSGAQSKSGNRGRPLTSRAGPLLSGARLSLVDTLRAAAPWQTLRRRETTAKHIQVRRSDFRIRRFVQRKEATTIFVVDASGSTALQRLAEAKGAVEMLLAKAYVARARVALIAFRGAEAELLLPPTRSLARAKARLADLPGGGGTPLAAGVEAGLVLALAERSKDHTPLLVFLTDGRANVGLGGAPGRPGAESDAIAVARRVAEAGVASLFVDTSPRAQPGGDRFALAMGGAYVPLPYLDGAAVAGLVGELRAVTR